MAVAQGFQISPAAQAWLYALPLIEMATTRARMLRAPGAAINRLTHGRTLSDHASRAVTTPNSAQQDFVLVRTDGVPLYNFGAVVDDVSMAITLVARARDHMVNTPPQIMIYEALGYERLVDMANLLVE